MSGVYRAHAWLAAVRHVAAGLVETLPRTLIADTNYKNERFDESGDLQGYMDLVARWHRGEPNEWPAHFRYLDGKLLCVKDRQWVSWYVSH